ncbi:ABC transporter substrate-binding protein [Alcaligenes endophyticus]|uniref:ABC transporter substrate-binding protein n=1 Tax=Alcaligenes endophyticus TaxID=1929088 RepID=A0ABT8EJX6_9BURK|nr:ABC transporter substrate-binding protein [Alcaligenes endophyticus]MCX5591768.1 ABC transporter substrate-binding protein [Alcaligenes endophyticus]MDN4121445.1 ABC transporter substrate-binding protein [Alcaligenes endophyticus]
MSTKRIKHWLKGSLVAALLGSAIVVQAAEKEIVIGGSIPMSGVFAFAGIGIHAGIQDYVKIINDAGGVEGYKLRYVPEDSGYKVDVSVAAFKKITGQNDVNFYYGDSTGFSKTINEELNRSNSILMSGASFATELNDPAKFPYQFIPGPDYTEMFGIMLRHIANEKPGAKVAFIYSDTEFGRDPIQASKKTAEELGLTVSAELMTPPASVDVSTEIAKLRRARPDFAIFHGYILGPIPEFIGQARKMGLDTQFMGTFWTMDNSTVMQMKDVADGFMGVMPYRYYYDESSPAPMLEKIREMRPDYQNIPYIQGFLSAMLYTEAAKRTLAEGKPMTADNLKAALNSLENFDTGGLIGVPVTIRGNSIPVGRIYRADVSKEQMVPVSDWIVLE